VPAHALFPQLLGVVERYLREKVIVQAPADLRDVFLAPYYTWVVERLTDAIGPNTAEGEAPEMPRYEARRGAGSTAEVDFWTSREPREVVRSHVNFMVPDTKKWEQSAAYLIDTHPATQAFVKNAGLGFAIPYIHNGQTHEYIPDFIIQLTSDSSRYLIAETKGFDELEEVKREAAERWVRAVNVEGSFGRWHYGVAKQVSEIPRLISSAAGA
jgi:type III restriction enzyme